MQVNTPRYKVNSLRIRLLSLIVLVLFPAIGFAFYTFSQQSAAARQKVEQQALQLAQLAASRQEQLVVGTKQLLTALSKIPSVRDGDTAACNALFVDLREQYPSYTNFYMIDTNGDTVCTGLPNADPINVKNAPWFIRAMSQNGFTAGDYSIGLVTKRPIVTFAYPVLDDAGKIKYQIGAALSLEWVNDFISVANLAENITLTAVDRNGLILYRYPEAVGVIGTRWPDDSLVHTVIAQQTGFAEGRGILNTPRLFGFAPLENTNGSAYVLIGIPYDTAYAEVNLQLRQNLLQLAFIGILMAGIAWYGSSRLIETPIDAIIKSARQLANGQLSARVDLRAVRNTHELKELAQDFNKMADALQQSQDLLEKRVAERTSRLSFLTDASTAMVTSLVYQQSLDQVAQLAVPYMADWCHVDILQADGSIQRLAVAHIDPTKAPFLYEMNRHFPADLDAKRGAGKVIRTGEPDYEFDVPEGLMKSYAQSAEHLALLDKFDTRSFIIVPLRARGRTFGAMTFASSTPNRYSEEDVTTAMAIAHRASLAIDNAYLYEMEQQALLEAKSAIHARDEFLSVAAHELKTPVTSIRGFGQVLQRQLKKGQLPDPERLTQIIDKLDMQTQKLTVLINQLLDISRIDSGQLKVDRTPSDVVAIVKDVARTAQENTTHHLIDVTAPDSLTLDIDPIRIEQVLTNLFDNAIKYSPDGGTISANIAATEPDCVSIIITDPGVGVPVEQRQHLFKRFYRASTGQYFQGMGLGLYICRQIIQLHNGELTAEFPEEGGTKMVIQLPR